MKQNGFTLLEIILALSILATIGIITINILSGQIATRQKLADLNADEHSLDATLSRIAKDLQGAYLSDQNNLASLNVNNRANIPQFYFKADNLIFFTMAYRSYLSSSNQSNQAFVRYSTKQNPNDSNKKQLIRTIDTDFVDSLEQDDVGLSQVLIDDIENFTIQFWDGNKFRPDWDSRANDTANTLPKLVKIHLSAYSTEAQGPIKINPKKEDRKSYALDTLVYLNSTQGKKEISSPTWTEYKWQ